MPEGFLQELKARSDIAEIAASYISLKRRGRNLIGLCPFHSEKTPSFNLYPENGSFYCFGCGAGGDVITFIRKIENLDYMEAVRFLAQRAGLQVPENNVDDSLAKQKARIFEINRESARFFHQELLSSGGNAGLEYLQNRGLSLKTIRHFGLGFSPASRFELIDYLKKKGFLDEELVQANVAFRSRTGRIVSRFFDRVMYPIIDLRGNVIAFGGRILGDGKPKYLNTSDTPVFRKSNGLFAMNFAKNFCQEQLILAEGYMDVIALHQAGFQNAIATLGTALTIEQARLMARYTKEVVISYDSDTAGQKAAARAISILRDTGVAVKVLTIPGSKDPDEYIRSFGDQGAARFKQLLQNSGNDVEYRLQKIKNSCDLATSEGKVSYLTAAVEVLATLENRIEQEVYAGRLAEEIGIDRSAILLQIGKSRKKIIKNQQQKTFRAFQQNISGITDTINPEKSKHLRACRAEEALIAFLFNNPDRAKTISEKMPPEKFCTEFNRRVYQALLGKIIGEKDFSLTAFSEDFSIDEIGSIARMMATYPPTASSAEDAEEYIHVILREGERDNIQNITTESPEEIQSYLQKLKEQKK